MHGLGPTTPPDENTATPTSPPTNKKACGRSNGNRPLESCKGSTKYGWFKTKPFQDLKSPLDDQAVFRRTQPFAFATGAHLDLNVDSRNREDRACAKSQPPNHGRSRLQVVNRAALRRSTEASCHQYGPISPLSSARRGRFQFRPMRRYRIKAAPAAPAIMSMDASLCASGLV